MDPSNPRDKNLKQLYTNYEHNLMSDLRVSAQRKKSGSPVTKYSRTAYLISKGNGEEDENCFDPTGWRRKQKKRKIKQCMNEPEQRELIDPVTGREYFKP